MQPKSARKPSAVEDGERLVRYLLNDFARAQDQKKSAESRLSKVAAMIQLALGSLPPDKRALYSQRFDEMREGVSAPPRGGPVYGSVVNLIARKPQDEWSAAKIMEALNKLGTEADAKAIHNILNYLANTRRLRRVGRGWYVVRDLGVAFQTDHDVGLEPTDDYGEMY